MTAPGSILAITQCRVASTVVNSSLIRKDADPELAVIVAIDKQGGPGKQTVVGPCHKPNTAHERISRSASSPICRRSEPDLALAI
jgi:hypothetical protein